MKEGRRGKGEGGRERGGGGIDGLIRNDEILDCWGDGFREEGL
jgi:hypothetical protein